MNQDVKKVAVVLAVGCLALVLLLAIGSGGKATMVAELSLQTPSPQIWAPQLRSGPTPTRPVPATATARTSPAPSGVVLTNTVGYYPQEYAAGWLFFQGELWNNTPSNVENVWVAVTLRDAAGQVVATSEGQSSAEIIHAGLVSSFWVGFDDPPSWESYEMSVTYQETARSQYFLEVTFSEMGCDDYSGHLWVRYITRNQYSEQRVRIRYILTVYHVDGPVLYVGCGGGNDWNVLNPGETEDISTGPHDWYGWPDCDEVSHFDVQIIGD